MDEFTHYFRICLDRILSSEEAKSFLLTVNKHAEVEADEEDVIMVYHVDSDGRHCYDVRLTDDIIGDAGDDLVRDLEELFQGVDFDAESSMDVIDEEIVFENLNVTKEDKDLLALNFNRWYHQRWIDTMVSEGWSWGTKLDNQAKTHPDLRPWDELVETYRPNKSNSVEYILEQLKDMGYKLVK